MEICTLQDCILAQEILFREHGEMVPIEHICDAYGVVTSSMRLLDEKLAKAIQEKDFHTILREVFEVTLSERTYQSALHAMLEIARDEADLKKLQIVYHIGEDTEGLYVFYKQVSDGASKAINDICHDLFAKLQRTDDFDVLWELYKKCMTGSSSETLVLREISSLAVKTNNLDQATRAYVEAPEHSLARNKNLMNMISLLPS